MLWVKGILVVACFVCCKASSLKETDFCLIVFFFKYFPDYVEYVQFRKIFLMALFPVKLYGFFFQALNQQPVVFFFFSLKYEEEKKMKNCAKMVLSRSLS